MRTSEVNESLVGKRVRITDGLYKGEGTIVATVVGRTKNHPKGIAEGEPEEVICSKGVRVHLDKPVFQATGYGVQHTEWWEDETDMTSRVYDDWGSLQLVKLIEE